MSRVPLTLSGIVLTPPDPNSSPSPQPELTLGLRAPPTLLSTSSGGKSTITHVSSPGTVTRLGSVTHVTTFSHASPGNRGGCNFKVSTPPASPVATPRDGLWQLAAFLSSATVHTQTLRLERGHRCCYSTDHMYLPKAYPKSFFPYDGLLLFSFV